jgi:hypothetical protein
MMLPITRFFVGVRNGFSVIAEPYQAASEMALTGLGPIDLEPSL